MDTEEKRLRKKNTLDPVLCPVCGITIRPNELANHYQKELENLNKIKNKKINSPVMSSSSGSNGKAKAGETSSVTNKSDNIDDCWGTYQKIKENRNARLKVCKKAIKYRDPYLISVYLIHRRLKTGSGKLTSKCVLFVIRKHLKILVYTLKIA